jgi:integrase
MDFEKNLEKINQRLKAGNIRLTIESQGKKLYLRGIFPPKNNDRSWHQQRLTLKVSATPAGLKYAEAKAKEISALLDLNQFDWSKFITQKSESFNLSDCLKKLEKDYFSTRTKSETSLNTWEHEYLKPLSGLPQNKQLTVEVLKEHILMTPPDTRTRRRYALACAKLADTLGIDHDLRKLVGNYGIKSLSPRSLPDDLTISNLINNFETPSWRWVYGIMACYGVRNHEVFALDLLDFPIAFINRGKTGERYTWALFPEWAEMWQLQKIVLPEVTGKTNSNLGNRVTKAFERNQIPFSPYNLRHAWAVRSLEFGLDISLASAQMGHSVAVHSKIYHHWITKDVHQRAMNIILSNPNRPIPPPIS